MAGTLYQDYDCTTCRLGQISVPHGTQVRDVIACPSCGALRDWKWVRTRTETYVPRVFGHAPALDIHVGRVAPIGAGVRVDTLRDIRRIERESEQAERNGEGQAVRFRLYSSGDRYTNSFGEVPQEKPSFTRPDGRPRLTVNAVDAAHAEASGDLGPGVTDQTQHDVLNSVE